LVLSSSALMGWSALTQQGERNCIVLVDDKSSRKCW
jgi:hypothetical protein